MIRLSDGEASARQCHVSLKKSRHVSIKVTLKEYHDLDLLSNDCHTFLLESGAKRLEKVRFSATLSSKTATHRFTTAFGESISSEAMRGGEARQVMLHEEQFLSVGHSARFREECAFL
jgi:hypothetical protein